MWCISPVGAMFWFLLLLALRLDREGQGPGVGRHVPDTGVGGCVVTWCLAPGDSCSPFSLPSLPAVTCSGRSGQHGDTYHLGRCGWGHWAPYLHPAGQEAHHLYPQEVSGTEVSCSRAYFSFPPAHHLLSSRVWSQPPLVPLSSDPVSLSLSIHPLTPPCLPNPTALCPIPATLHPSASLTPSSPSSQKVFIEYVEFIECINATYLLLLVLPSLYPSH